MVFPAPWGPRNPKISPFFTKKLTSSAPITRRLRVFPAILERKERP
ncbi:MAG: hypothetical protein ACXABG_10740 [Promethearchaeota archaeon]